MKKKKDQRNRKKRERERERELNEAKFGDLYSFLTCLLPQSLSVDKFYVVFVGVLPP